MKKYTFIRDKKLLIYLLVFTIGVAISFSITLVKLNSLLSSTVANEIIVIILVPVSILFLLMEYFILKDIFAKYQIFEENLRYGTFGFGKIAYYLIDDIYFEKDIVLVCGNMRKRIRVFNLEENKDKYIELLEEIKTRSELDFSIDHAYERLKYYNEYEYIQEGIPLRLNSWIFVIFVNVIIQIVSTLLTLGTSALSRLIPDASVKGTNPLISILLLAIYIVCASFIAKKHKHAPKIIIGTNVIILLISSLNIVISNPFELNTLVSIILPIIIQAPLLLLMYRYFTISKRVKHTFIYDKFQTVEKMDKEIDPGFKLFTNNPSSIYASTLWIVFPASLIVLAIISFVVALTMFLF